MAVDSRSELSALSLKAAVGAASWLESVAIPVATQDLNALRWAADPANPSDSGESLYSGTPGVVLFFVSMARATGDERYVTLARRGAEWLLQDLESAQRRSSGEVSTGLYEGVAGMGWVLLEVEALTGDERYGDGAAMALAELERLALRSVDAAGVETITWSDTTDIISGTAGTGLVLLEMYRRTGSQSALQMATGAGRWLVGQAIDGEVGSKWGVSPDFPRLYPNFSHGTAGVAYFLASLAMSLEETSVVDARPFQERALAGAEYLKAIADRGGDLCLVFHHEPGGEDLHYLSWCHGPAGTARLFFQLYRMTGDAAWLDWVQSSAEAVLVSGIPEAETPGFWNNVSQCCGTAGVLDFFLGLHQGSITGVSELGDEQTLEFVERLGRQLLSSASEVNLAESGSSESELVGLQWIQAENRTEPDNLVAQTGWMQGAAGIGGALLRLHLVLEGRDDPLRFPDNPF